MKDPRVDVLLVHLNLVCKYYEYNCGSWCNRAYGGNEDNDCAKHVSCDGQLSKCELKESDRIKPDYKEFGEE